ncbi:MAG: response regulator transcription factor [Myxococcales bacterium]|nr:response regulator transcription factor [Myxococcales bacterium]
MSLVTAVRLAQKHSARLGPVKVLLIEDDERLAAQARPAIEGAGFECVWAPDALRGLSAVGEERPDLVLLDLMLPDRSGFSVLEELRSRSAIPVIVLTARVLGEDKVAALDLGADDYLTKPFWDQELIARIRAVLRRQRAVHDAEVFAFGQVRIDLGSRNVQVDGVDVRLTPTEFNLLTYLLRRPGQALRSERIIDMVLLTEDASLPALQAQMSRLRRKLGEDGRRIQTVWGIGYRFDPS